MQRKKQRSHSQNIDNGQALTMAITDIKDNFEFVLSTRIKFGCRIRNELVDILSFKKWNSIGIVIDHNLLGLRPIEEMLSNLQLKCSKVIIGHCKIPEPTYNSLEEIRGCYHDQGLDVIVGIGGGSALDMAKGVAVLVNNRESAIYYRGFDKMTEPVLPIIAIPTTAGTGSEITPNASFIDTSEKRKMGINGEAVRPKYALIDPELTLSCPEKPSISAGVDSIVHAVEAYVAKKTNPMSRMFAKEGFKRVFLNLPFVLENPQNIKYREEVMYGAFLSGVALMNSGTGPAAAMSYPLGVHYKVPHGIGGGIFLPHIVKYNIENGYYDYAELYEAINRDNTSNNREEKSKNFFEKIFALWESLSIPEDLTQIGLNIDNLTQFVKETMELKGALDQNPVPFYEKEIEQTLNILGVK